MVAAILLAARYWRAVIGVALLAAIAALLVVDAGHRRERDRAVVALSAEQAAHRQTVLNYQGAAVLAGKRDAETLARVTGEQIAITERITHDYQARVDDSTSRYERLREQADAYSRSANDADVSAAREAACRAYAATACDRIPALLKAAQDNTDQLLALIAWAKAQGDVSVADEVAQ